MNGEDAGTVVAALHIPAARNGNQADMVCVECSRYSCGLNGPAPYPCRTMQALKAQQ